MAEKSKKTNASKSQVGSTPVISKQETILQSMRTMRTIVDEMSETSPARTAVMTDTTKLKEVVFPNDGGVLTFIDGYEHPYRGFPYFEQVERVNDIKKIARKVFGKVYGAAQGIGKLKLMALLPMMQPLIEGFRYAFWYHTSKYRMKPMRYSQPVRELYKAWNTLGDSEEIREWRDITCLVLEFDNAYRYRFQDVVSELNKEDLKKNPAKEITRMIKLLCERETESDSVAMWKQREKLVYFVLKFSKENLKMVQGVLLAINLDEIMLNVNDRYFCAMRKDYHFGFCLRGEEKCFLGAPQDR